MSVFAAHNRELFRNLVRREVRGRYKGSVLGFMWTLIIPLVMMLAYTLVFSILFRFVDARIPHYPLFLLTGLALWVTFAGAMVESAASLVGNAPLIKTVRFPRAFVPLATVAGTAITMVVMVLVLIPLNLWLMPGDRRAMLLLPLVLLAIAMMVVGVSLAVSVLNVYFRDVQHILTALLLPWFFLTPILYSFEALPLATDQAWIVDVLKMVNFVAPFVLALQDVLFWGAYPSWRIWTYIFVVGGLILVGGYLLFRRLQRNLAIEL